MSGTRVRWVTGPSSRSANRHAMSANQAVRTHHGDGVPAPSKAGYGAEVRGHGTVLSTYGHRRGIKAVGCGSTCWRTSALGG
jgi:hypothetical protein